MFLTLDRQGPLRAQLARALKSAILHGRVGLNEPLPATRLLAIELNISRNTVQAAYERLRLEGYITTRVGSGSYVLRKTPKVSRASLSTKSEGAPQSRYAERTRSHYDPERIAGRTPAGIRHAFEYGVPMTNPSLTHAWARELSRAARYTSPNYPSAQGVARLRSAVCAYLALKRGVDVESRDILIVAGTQQAIALTARVLLDEGDEAGLEEPHYSAFRSALLAHGARIRSLAVDECGVVCASLPRRAPKLICITPSHQFPSGVVLALSRRKVLLEYAVRNDTWILEDDYDGAFRYDGQPIPALRSLDTHNRVIYVGTFSKALFPALRLGYLVMPPQLRRDFISAKQLHDFGSPSVEQVALAAFMENGGFERHERRTSRALRMRRATLIAGLRKCSRGRLELADSHAGMHVVVWIRGRSAKEGERLIAHAARRGLGIFSIAAHYLNPPDRAGLLMGYGALSVGEIETALKLFERCLDEVFSADV